MSSKYIDSISRSSILKAIAGLPDTFYTKDVSEHAEVMAANAGPMRHSHYHAFIGKFLQQLYDSSGNKMLIELKKGGSRGSLWQKAGPVNEELKSSLEPGVVVSHNPNIVSFDETDIDTGPQYSGDKPFTKRMRFKQSNYRANVLKLPCGYGPTKTSTSKYGNMLTDAGANQGANFLSPKIFEVVKERVRQGHGAIDDFRLFRNMLSSQPLCFNLFGLMKNDLELATAFWKNHFPDTIEEVIKVEFEYAPQPASEYLNDRTAFDAYFEYFTKEANHGIIGVEVKFTEPFSQKVYDTSHYRELVETPGSPWKKQSWAELSDIRWNQLWRDHLLAYSIIQHAYSTPSEGFFVLVRHPEDGECEANAKMYQSILRSDDKTFVDLPMDKLLAAYDSMELSDEVREWLEKFRERYI
jgi:hypothetical protein